MYITMYYEATATIIIQLICMYMYNMYVNMYVNMYACTHALMRDAEGRKKQAMLNKQQGKATQQTQGSPFS